MSDEDVNLAGQQLARVSICDKKPLQEVQNLPLPELDTPVKPDHHDGIPRKKNTPVRSGSDSSPSVDDQVKYNKLVTKSKKLTSEGCIPEALHMLKKAIKLSFSEKLAKRITKMEAYLNECAKESSEDGDDEDSNMIDMGDGFYLFKDLYKKLYAHQKKGVLWFWKLYRRKKGGILGDDMGLGKTIQVIAFLSGMFDMEKINSVLIINPVSVMSNWERECTKWAPGIRVSAFHGTSKKERERSLRKVQHRGGVLLTTYGMVVTSWEQLSQKDGREFVWDYVILDEGHKIKNPTKTTKAVHAIPAANRIILTGTPVQNNLRELWSLFDFVHQGSLLGTSRTFKIEYDTPITRSREKDATNHERKLGEEMAQSLKKIIDPYFLRRTKDEVQKATLKSLAGADEQETDQAKMPSLTRKNDLVIWLFLSTAQQKIYEDFLSLDTIKELLMTTKSPLVALTVLKKICDHPRLLSNRACAELGLDGDNGQEDSMLDHPSALESAATKIQNVADEILINESGKLQVLIELLDNLKGEGHRSLVFSQSRKMLDIIQKIITNRGHKVMRLDGTVRLICDRDQRIKTFQNDDSFSVFLLTTQVGGVGLTLTAADRVIIYDPSWNPATDAQAVDRVFRIGQNRNIVIYRLITCGSVEEKIYRRQIFKDSITRQTTGATKNPYRYFSKSELRELFTLDNPRVSTTQEQLQEMHGDHRRSDVSLDEHIAYLYSLDIFGVSDHDLMFTQEALPDEVETEGDCVGSSDYIQNRVQKAQELLQMESSLPSTMEERMGLPKFNGEARKQFPNRKPATFNPKPYSENYVYDQSSVSPIDLTKIKQMDEAADVTIDLTSPIKKENKMHGLQATPESHMKIEVEDDRERGDIFITDIKLEKVKEDENVNGTVQGNMDKMFKSEVKWELTESPQSVCLTGVTSPPKVTIDLEDNSICDDNPQISNDVSVDENCHNQNNDLVEEIKMERSNNSRQKSEMFHQPKLPSTPTQSQHFVIKEELIISPDPSLPLIGLKAKRSSKTHYSASPYLVEDQSCSVPFKKVSPKRLMLGEDDSETHTISPGSLLSRTILDPVDNSPELMVNPKSSTRSPGSLLSGTILDSVGNSPELKVDLKSSTVSTGSLLSRTIVDSVGNSPESVTDQKQATRSPGSLLDRTLLLTDFGLGTDTDLCDSTKNLACSPGSLLNRTVLDPVLASLNPSLQNKSKTFSKSPASILSQTLMESPDARSSTSSSGSERGKQLWATYVEESPDNATPGDHADNVIEYVENTPDVRDTSDLNCPDSDLSEEISSSFQFMNTTDVVEDGDGTPVKKTTRRRSVCRRKVIESSDDESTDQSRPSSAELVDEEQEESSSVDAGSRPESAMSIGENTNDGGSALQDAMETEKDSVIKDDEVSENEDNEISKNGDNEVSENEDNEISENEDNEISENGDNEVSENEDNEISENEDNEISENEDNEISENGDNEVSENEDNEISENEDDEPSVTKNSESSVNESKESNKEEENEEDSCIDEDGEEDEDTEEEEEEEERNDEEAAEESECTDSEEKDEFDSLPQKLQRRFLKLMDRGSNFYKEKNLEDALVYILQALEIYADPEAQRWAQKIERKISRNKNGK